MNDDWRADVARAIADGEPVDWSALRAVPAASTDPAVLEELRVLEQVVRVHKQPVSWSSFDHLPAAWGPLTVVEHVGRGTFGDVYRAHDPRLDRAVALKLLRRQDPAGASAVVGEARLLARVSHPNVVTVYGAERIGGQVGVWMRFIDGPTLEEEAATEGTVRSADRCTHRPGPLRCARGSARRRRGASGRQGAECDARAEWARGADGFWRRQ